MTDLPTESPHETPPATDSGEDGPSMLVNLIVAAVVVGACLIGSVSGSGIAVVAFLILAPILLWTLTARKRQSLPANQTPPASLTVSQSLLLAAGGLFAGIVTFFTICTGTILGSLTLLDGGPQSLVILLGLSAGFVVSYHVAVRVGLKYQTIGDGDQERNDDEERLDHHQTRDTAIKIDPQVDGSEREST